MRISRRVSRIRRSKGWFTPTNMIIVLVAALILTWIIYAVAGPIGFLVIIALILYFGYKIFFT